MTQRMLDRSHSSHFSDCLYTCCHLVLCCLTAAVYGHSLLTAARCDYGRPLALGVTENDYYIFRRVFIIFFQTLFLRRLCADFLETSAHDVDLSPIQKVTFTFV